jgi:hypothetical protein
LTPELPQAGAPLSFKFRPPSNLPANTRLILELYSLHASASKVSLCPLEKHAGTYYGHFTPDTAAAVIWFRWIVLNPDSTQSELLQPLHTIPIFDSSYHPIKEYYISLARLFLQDDMLPDPTMFKWLLSILKEGMERFPEYIPDPIYQHYLRLVEAIAGSNGQ